MGLRRMQLGRTILNMDVGEEVIDCYRWIVACLDELLIENVGFVPALLLQHPQVLMPPQQICWFSLKVPAGRLDDIESEFKVWVSSTLFFIPVHMGSPKPTFFTCSSRFRGAILLLTKPPLNRRVSAVEVVAW